MRRNAHQLDDIVHMAEQLRAASVKFNVVQPTARGEKLREVKETLNVAKLMALGRHVVRNRHPRPGCASFSITRELFWP